jgi:hypothetical protein
MQPLDFLAAVLPSSGVYCAAEFNTKKKEHVFVDSLDGLVTAANSFAAQNRDVYFALAAFKEAGKRTADNARVIHSLFIDIDISEEKKYKTRTEGRDAYLEFMGTTGMHTLGEPIVVSSGGGFHVYWPFTEEVEIAQWKPVAENFKRLCKQEGFEIDWNCTADAARVLRVPGTYNQKFDPPKHVKILKEGSGPFGFAALTEFIESKLKVKPVLTPVFELSGQRPTRTASSIALMQNNRTLFKNIIAKTQAGTGCGQLAHYVEHAQEDGMEPLWRGLLSWAKHSDDADKACVWLTKQHPYDTERMEQKLRDIKGPYGCLKLDSVNPGICPSCPHYGKITNALILGREVKVDNTEKDDRSRTTNTTNCTQIRHNYEAPTPQRVLLRRKERRIQGQDRARRAGQQYYDPGACHPLRPVRGQYFEERRRAHRPPAGAQTSRPTRSYAPPTGGGVQRRDS